MKHTTLLFTLGILCNFCLGQIKIKVEIEPVKIIDTSKPYQLVNQKNESTLPKINLSNSTLTDWLNIICISNAPDSTIIAYNFGLFETSKGYSIYLIGSNNYDKNNEDWATQEDFTPIYKYYSLSQKEFGHLKFTVVQNKVKKTIKKFMKSETYKKSFFSKAKAITVGFDDGNLERIK